MARTAISGRPWWDGMARQGSACGLGSLDDGGVQPLAGLGGRGDGDAGESRGAQFVTVLLGGEGGGGAADAVLRCGALAGIEAGLGDDVADPESTAGDQDTERFGEYARLVGGEVDDAVLDDHVHAGSGQRDVFDAAAEEVDVVGSGLGGVGAGEGEHVVAGIAAVDGYGRADTARR